MNKKTILKTITLAVALTILAVVGGNASAEPVEKRMGDKGLKEGQKQECEKEGRHKWIEKLNLTADQKKKVEAIRSERKQKMKAVVEQLNAEHQKMHDMLKGDATDPQLREQHGKVAALRAKMGETFFDSMLQIRAVLTPEQRKQMGSFHHEGGMGRDGEHRHEHRD